MFFLPSPSMLKAKVRFLYDGLHLALAGHDEVPAIAVDDELLLSMFADQEDLVYACSAGTTESTVARHPDPPREVTPNGYINRQLLFVDSVQDRRHVLPVDLMDVVDVDF